MKTKSSAKKRYKVTANGLVIAAQANKRHNMRKRSKRQLRNQRGTDVLCTVEARRAIECMPYAHVGIKRKRRRIGIEIEAIG